MRLRFAPSPTGALHIGGARTALYNWLLARGSGGALVLRIEDTDRERSTPENVEQILDALRWLELDWDEGPIFQTQNAERHARGACAAARRAATPTARPPPPTTSERSRSTHGHDRGFRGEPEAEGAVRLRVPDEGETVVDDVIRGEARFQHVHMDDPVIARADGSVLYNFAVAIDDLDAGITHVVRGEDHLSNTPKQLLVFEALGEPAPRYAHLPLLHGPDGKKLSKRHGAASVQELRDAGYLPEAVVNYIALLGAGFDAEEEIFPREELARRLRLERISKSPAVFDERKLRHFNGHYLRELTRRGADRAAGGVHRPRRPARRRRDQPREDPDAGRLLAARRLPLRRAGRRPGRVGARRSAPRAARRRSPPRARRWRRSIRSRSAQEAVEAALRGLVEARGWKPKQVFQPVRVAIAGTTISPGIFESVALLGREETLRRIDAALGRAAAARPRRAFVRFREHDPKPVGCCCR